MATYHPLSGSQRTLLPHSRPSGPVNRNEIASLTVRLRSSAGPKALIDKAYELANTPLSKRKYLTHEELAKLHGASQADIDKVEQFAQKYDLMVTHSSAAQRCVVLRGRLGDLLSAFHADVRIYHHPSGSYRGRQGEITLPAELVNIVTGVFGFDTRPKHRAPHRQKHTMTHAGPGGNNGVAATVFAKRYKFPAKAGGKVLDGSGQTIAIIELGGSYRNSDLEIFFQEIGTAMPDVTAVSIDHAGNDPSIAQPDDGEVMLDIEVAGAVCPKAKFAIYFAPNKGDKGFLDAINAAIHDTQRKPGVISISWGGPEDFSEQQTIDAYHELFAAAATLGITVCAASGDHGTADLSADSWDKMIHVDHPACDDLVLGCGGTQIDSGTDVAWNDGTTFDVNVDDGGGWAGGGGISTVFAVPPYQTKAKLPKSIATGNAGRGVPDIAMSATNYFTRVDNDESPSGGTSAVAPLMAALVARLNQAKQKNVGFLNPFLYANASKGVVHDVTTGTNAIKQTIKGYKARKGWDACTGLGTPDGTAILKNLT